LIKYMINKGVSGIEVYSSYHNEDDIYYYNNLCDELNVIKSIGTDFHGKTKPSIYLGSVKTDIQNNLIEYFENR
ncbi:MAG: phosphatase, partial [Erysipelotrichaceae bacterium]